MRRSADNEPNPDERIDETLGRWVFRCGVCAKHRASRQALKFDFSIEIGAGPGAVQGRDRPYPRRYWRNAFELTQHKEDRRTSTMELEIRSSGGGSTKLIACSPSGAPNSPTDVINK